MYKVPLTVLIESRDVLSELLDAARGNPDVLEAGDPLYERTLKHIKLLENNYVCPENAD